DTWPASKSSCSGWSARANKSSMRVPIPSVASASRQWYAARFERTSAPASSAAADGEDAAGLVTAADGCPPSDGGAGEHAARTSTPRAAKAAFMGGSWMTPRPYHDRPHRQMRPLIDRSPLTLLADLGAVSAVLLLIFKDTILSVMASIQLSSNDMLRLGDWIAMPSANVDGFVVDIALHTIKVQNRDKTISTVPTWHLISHSYRNWRGMYDSGGRRIRRALHIDVTSVHFHTEEELACLRQFNLLKDYFEGKRDEIAQWNRRVNGGGAASINHRRLSNLGSFRAYMQAYLDRSPDINHDMLCSVRQLDPDPDGVPLQIYAYTSNTNFVEHEDAQSDIFDHLISILPDFGLALFQQPTGADLRAGLAGSRAGSVLEQVPAAQPGPARSTSGPR